LPDTLSWKNINWQNSILKYVLLISPKNIGPALVPIYTILVICVILLVKPDMLAIVPYSSTPYCTHLLSMARLKL
jgi:hypothetical protein